jgi:hypothetical protein
MLESNLVTIEKPDLEQSIDAFVKETGQHEEASSVNMSVPDLPTTDTVSEDAYDSLISEERMVVSSPADRVKEIDDGEVDEEFLRYSTSEPDIENTLPSNSSSEVMGDADDPTQDPQADFDVRWRDPRKNH